MKFAIILLNWNGENLLEKFMPHLVKYSSDAEIYIVDNASTDDSVSFLKKYFPSIKIILHPKNYGFAKGYNIALEKIQADIFVLLNSDVQVTKNWLLPFQKKFEKNPEIGILQPKIKDLKKKNYFEYAGAAGGFLDYFGYPYCRGRLFEILEKDNKQYENTIYINWASGACFGIRSALYKKIGGFDEDYFAHQEEIDLCWRVKSEGFKICYTAESEVFHIGGATLKESNHFKTFLNFRNSLFSIVKNVPKKAVFQIIFMRLFLDGWAALFFIFQSKPIHAWAILKAHFSFYKNLLKMIKKRKNQKQNFNYLHKSIVFAYFIKRIKVFRKL